MPAEEFYPRPIRYDLYQQDPSAQALDLLASGAREQIRQGDRYGEIKARSEENKWKAISDIPNKIGEGLERGTKMRREGEQLASEENSRQLQRDQVRQQMEEQNKQSAVLDEAGPDGRSRRQKMADYEANRGDVEAERFDKQFGETRRMNDANIAHSQSELELSKRQTAIAEANLKATLDNLGFAKEDRRKAEINQTISTAVATNDPGALAEAQGVIKQKYGLNDFEVGQVTTAAQKAAQANAQQGEAVAWATDPDANDVKLKHTKYTGHLNSLGTKIAQYKAHSHLWDNAQAEAAKEGIVRDLRALGGQGEVYANQLEAGWMGRDGFSTNKGLMDDAYADLKATLASEWEKERGLIPPGLQNSQKIKAISASYSQPGGGGQLNLGAPQGGGQQGLGQFFGRSAPAPSAQPQPAAPMAQPAMAPAGAPMPPQSPSDQYKHLRINGR